MSRLSTEQIQTLNEAVYHVWPYLLQELGPTEPTEWPCTVNISKIDVSGRESCNIGTNVAKHSTAAGRSGTAYPGMLSRGFHYAVLRPSLCGQQIKQDIDAITYALWKRPEAMLSDFHYIMPFEKSDSYDHTCVLLSFITSSQMPWN